MCLYVGQLDFLSHHALLPSCCFRAYPLWTPFGMRFAWDQCCDTRLGPRAHDIQPCDASKASEHGGTA